MSRPSYSSENAAPAAPVSPASPCRSVGGIGGIASATPPPNPSPDAPPPPRPAAAGPQDVSHVSVPPVAPAPQPGLPASAAATVSATTSSVPSSPSGDQIKYHRGPAVLARPHGPSLLTQALATARGIHNPASRLELAPPKTSPAAPTPDDPSATRSPPEPQQHPSREVETPDSHNAPSPPSDGGALTPRASPRPASAMPSTTAVATTVAYPYGPAEASPKAYGMLDLGEVNSMLSGHRDFLAKGKGRGTSAERTDAERRAHDRPARPAHFAHISSNNTGATPPHTEAHAPSDGGNTAAEGVTDVVPDARPRKAEHRLSMGPEKAWSISTGERAGCEDGQVEKSITEAIAGVEPNARASRKASHSLRFFKEGNPDDKGKRKDSRHVSQKLPPTAETSEPENGLHDGEAAGSRPVSLVEEVIPRTDKLARARSFPSDVPPMTVSPDDYSVGKRSNQAVRDAEFEELPHPVLVETDGLVSASVSDAERKLDAGARVCEATEEGEESGEEKISSALFLPHQGPEQLVEEAPAQGAPTRSAPPTRTLSRAEDFHPWLVVAGKPENNKAEGADYERKARPETADVPCVASEVEPTQADDSELADESEIGVHSPKPSRPVSQYHEEVIHDHQWAPKQPLEAIELVPYKHQVGGHTTLWRFSRRAVCKQLNNRENEFYERVERDHRDLLMFLPRYIGVLNVTFQKKQRRKSTLKREEAAAIERSQAAGQANAGLKPTGSAVDDSANTSDAASANHRIVSQSLQPPQNSVPTVTFVDNQHILPRNLLQPTPNSPVGGGRFRSASASFQETKPNENRVAEGRAAHPIRPSLQDHHQAHSWGATTVNKSLRNEVFNDAFLKQPIAIRRHRKGHQRAMPRRALQQMLRPTGSDPSLAVSREKEAEDAAASNTEKVIAVPGSRLTQTQSDVGQLGGCSEDDEAPKDVTGTSAPEPEILADSSPAQKKKRRYSGTGLRRKPKDVRDARGDLKYYEEADDVGYKSSKENQARAAIARQVSERPETPLESRIRETVLSTVPSSAASELPSPTNEFKRIPRPINPKEAQTQTDSRVEYFLLLEDLTAGMKRPCIMDLKMGTRQYGVDANPKKQKSQQGKCAKTTSRELGVRVCGLQVWDVKTQSYVFKDKYYGRDLKKGQEFQDALTRFLYDGVDRGSILRHIPTVLQKLDQLEVIISRLRGYRFYAASLLMFYDGEAGDDYDTAIEDSTTDFATDTEDAPRRTRRNPREIDFKMADFANCVTAGDLAKDKPCPPKHPNEPDRGFLRGLRSLRKYFIKIQRDTRLEMGLVAGQLRGVDEDGFEEEGSVSE
ncbi:inositol hexakisphosphate kinase 1 [Echria macrotheca]|uniref:Kinase n=1 Tax=Echria macrotheca TaxID=438768 RepID=A0AAJ0FHN1_9PEZI|nr:inositol hexakisphosphate kinase 1 [Echria macrotheca]